MPRLLKTTANACALLCAALLVQSFNTPFARRADAADGETPRRVAPTHAGVGSDARTTHAAAAFGELPLTFEANRGQAPPDVEYLARAAGYTLMLTRTGALLSLKSGKEMTLGATLRMSFPGADPASRPVGRGLQQRRVRRHGDGSAVGRLRL